MSGMETDEAEKLDAFSNKSTKVLSKNHSTEETDTCTTIKRNNRSPSHFDNQDTQTDIVMAEKRYTSLNT